VTATLDQGMGQHWPDLARAIFWSENYNNRVSAKGDDSELSSVDLGDLIQRIDYANPGWVGKTQQTRLKQALDTAVLANYTSERHELSKGLAIYAPFHWNRFSGQYADTRFARETRWAETLKKLHGIQKQHQEKPRIVELKTVKFGTEEPVTETDGGGGVALQARIAGDNLLWVEMLTLMRDEGNKGYLVLEKGHMVDFKYTDRRKSGDTFYGFPEFKGDDNTAASEFMALQGHVTDGKGAYLATVDMTDLNDNRNYRVPVIIERPGYEPFYATLLFDVVTWEPSAVIAELPQPDGSVALRGIQPEASDKVSLLFEFIADGGGESRYLRGQELLWGEGLKLLFDYQSAGRSLLLGASAISIGGRSDYRFTELKLVQGVQQHELSQNAKRLTDEQLIGTWDWYHPQGIN
jgi:hypothetical protein